jgi:hypothetical protein
VGLIGQDCIFQCCGGEESGLHELFDTQRLLKALHEATTIVSHVRERRLDHQAVLDALGKVRPVVDGLVTIAGFLVEVGLPFY